MPEGFDPSQMEDMMPGGMGGFGMGSGETRLIAALKDLIEGKENAVDSC